MPRNHHPRCTRCGTRLASFRDMGVEPTELDDLVVSPTAHGRMVATAVFYTAADYNTAFIAPLKIQINAWGASFDLAPWLSADLATRAVHAHFAQSTDGRMVPGCVIAQAKKILGVD